MTQDMADKFAARIAKTTGIGVVWDHPEDVFNRSAPRFAVLKPGTDIPYGFRKSVAGALRLAQWAVRYYAHGPYGPAYRA